jgi:hypothetical protein
MIQKTVAFNSKAGSLRNYWEDFRYSSPCRLQNERIEVGIFPEEFD